VDWVGVVKKGERVRQRRAVSVGGDWNGNREIRGLIVFGRKKTRWLW
jgi:hypothetical protein